MALIHYVGGAEEFFAQKANIRLAIGGPYEIQFDPKNEQSGTKGLKILSYAPEEMISFQWNAPTEYPEVRNAVTWVVVEMRPAGADQTHVTVTHYGWKEGPEWDQAYAHFVRGWGDLINRLERRFGFAHDGDVCMAKAAAAYLDQKLSRLGRWLWHVFKPWRLLRLEQAIRDHLFISYGCCLSCRFNQFANGILFITGSESTNHQAFPMPKSDGTCFAD